MLDESFQEVSSHIKSTITKTQLDIIYEDFLQ